MEDGTRVLLAAVDYVFWTKKLAGKVDRFEQALPEGTAAKELWISGRIDSAARQAFEARGWKVTERANKLLLK